MKKHLVILLSFFLMVCSAYVLGLGIGYNKGTGDLGGANVVADPLELINIDRAKVGVDPLEYDQRLTQSATDKACDMVNRGYFSHTDPDGRYAWHLFDEAGYRYAIAGENLVRNIPNAYNAHLRLMQSPTHRDNILNPYFTEIGIGSCGEYTVQHFGDL